MGQRDIYKSTASYLKTPVTHVDKRLIIPANALEAQPVCAIYLYLRLTLFDANISSFVSKHKVN